MKFKQDADGRSIIQKNDLKQFRIEWLEKNKDKFVKEERLAKWVELSTCSLDNFFIKALDCKKQPNGDMLEGDSELSMNKLLPCPEELRNTTSPVRAENGENEREFQERIKRHEKLYGATNWYDWQCKAWGTKWDIHANLADERKTELHYYFDSTWSPPINFFLNISEKYPNLSFQIKYDEPGMCFRGTIVVKEGEIVTEDHEDSYTPTCHDCEEEYDDNGECSCMREVEVATKPKKKTKKKK